MVRFGKERSGSRVIGLLVSIVALISVLSGTAQAEPPACTGEPAAIQTLNLTVGGVPTYGYYALPSTTPKGVVVLGHGYPTTAHSMVPLMPGIAQRDDAIVIAMDYHGTVDLEGPTGNTSRGWKVSEGAADSIAAAQLFTSTCQGLNPTRFVNTAFGVSMGGNMTGIAVSEHATRAGGSPLSTTGSTSQALPTCRRYTPTPRRSHYFPSAVFRRRAPTQRPTSKPRWARRSSTSPPTSTAAQRCAPAR